MGGERWTRIRELFDAALDLEPPERSVFLAKACAGDEALCLEVESLLETDADSPEARRLAAGAVRGLTPGPRTSLIGERVGDYRIRKVIGSGGMGTVYEAVQDHPARVVALKTLRFGLTSPSVRRRFEYEAEILGRLRHPGIAQIHSAGTYRDESLGGDVPFFAMEYVEDARPLHRFVRDEGLDQRRILELFTGICDAVHHGHQRGIVHRDLKPTNILVDRAGRPKIIDFGIARATEVDATRYTSAGEVLGTLQYMSPEQLDEGAEAVDVRADVYALGVILYELLTGRVPFDVSGKSLTSAARILRDQDPARPSSVARANGARIGPELDWIVLRAMAKDRERRYQAASELAADIRRYLANEPVLAGPPSRVYRLRVFVRRNRVAVAGAAAVVLALALGLLATAWQMRVAQAARGEAESEAAQARAVNDFLNRVLAWGDPVENIGGGEELSMREAIERASALLGDLGDQPLVEAAVRTTLGQAWRALGHLDRADENLRAALELRRSHLPADHPDIGSSLNALALAVGARGENEAALELLHEAIAIHGSASGVDGVALANCRNNLALSLYKLGRNEEAEAEYRRTIDELRGLDGDYVRFEAVALDGLASVLVATGRKPEARVVLGESLAAYEASGKGRHPYAAHAHWRLGSMHDEEGRSAEAEEHFVRAVAILRETLGDDHPETLEHLTLVAAWYARRDELASAQPLFELALAGRQQRYGPRDAATGREHERLGDILRRRGDFAAAETHLRQAAEILTEVLGHGDRQALEATNDLVGVLLRQGKHEEAEPLSVQAVSRASESLPEEDAVALYALRNRAELSRLQGRYDEALALCSRILDVRTRHFGESHATTLTAMSNVAVALNAKGKHAEAETMLREVLEVRKDAGMQESAASVLYRGNLVETLLRQDKLDAAAEVLPDALRAAEQVVGREHWVHAYVRGRYGVYLTKRGRYEAAEKELLDSLAVLERALGRDARSTQKLIEATVELYESWGKTAEAARLRAKLKDG